MPAFGENQKCGGSSGAEPGPSCPVGEEQGHQDASCWPWGVTGRQWQSGWPSLGKAFCWQLHSWQPERRHRSNRDCSNILCPDGLGTIA